MLLLLALLLAGSQAAVAGQDPCRAQREAAQKFESAAYRVLWGDGTVERNALSFCEMNARKSRDAASAAATKAESDAELAKWRDSSEHRAKIFSAGLCKITAMRAVMRRRAAGQTDGLAVPGASRSEDDLQAEEKFYRHVLELNGTPAPVDCAVDFIPELTTCQLLGTYVASRPEIEAPCATPTGRARAVEFINGPHQILEAEQKAKTGRLDPKSLFLPVVGGR